MMPGRQARQKEYEDHPVGYEHLAVSSTAVGLASVPTNANKAIIVVEDATIRWRTDSVDPDSSVGTKSYVNTTIVLDGRESVTNFKAIKQGTSDAKLSVNYYERK